MQQALMGEGPSPSGDAAPILAQGEVHIDEAISLPPGACLHIALRDTSLAGGTAVELDRVAIELAEAQGGAPLSQAFRLEGRGSLRGRYQVWATLDLQGNGRLSPGDWFSARSPSVDPRAPDQALIVTLVQVPLIP